jgi:Amt family ammonium transporter
MDTIEGLSTTVLELNAKLLEMEATMNTKMMALEATDRLLTENGTVTLVTDGLYTALMSVNDTVYAHKAGYESAMSHAWLIICGALVMFMHAGFSMLEAGCCRAGFAQSVLAKNLLNCCVSTLGWLVLGFPIAYGNMFGGCDAFPSCPVFGMGLTPQGDDSIIDTSRGPLDWFFQWAFCMTAATIVSGAVAERLQIGGYCVFCMVMTSIIYPVVVSWTWYSGGFLYQANYMDFAGSGIVHLTGGIGALVGTILVKPRSGRFDPAREQDFAPHDVPMIVLGTIILWFGWYGFNCGSTLGMSEGSGYMAAIVAVNTTIAPAFGGMVVTFARRAQAPYKWMTTETCGGILAGLVSITAGCGNVHPWAAVVIGSIGGVLYMLAADLLVKMQVDDPVQAFPVHGACGIWGVLAAVFFDWGLPYGTLHAWGGVSPTDGHDFAAGITAALTFLGLNIVWSGATLAITFAGLGAAKFLRVSEVAEKEGLDEHEFSPKAARAPQPFK